MAYISKVADDGGTVYDVKSKITEGIPYGKVDSTSTSTVFTATVDGITELTDGTCMLLENGVVTSASGFTLNINGLGAKPVYTNLAAATAETTKFNSGYTMLFVYDESRVTGGCWICYNGYDSNTNTIGYQLRTNSVSLLASDTGYRYRLWFTSADGTKFVPANTSTSTNATTARSLNSRPIDPFGTIVYRSTNGTCTAGTTLGATAIWEQYTFNIGYSYMKSGFALVDDAPVYVRCVPQSDGSAVMHDIATALPTAANGYIYIYLGTAYSTSSLELAPVHPVYYHDGKGVRLWTGVRFEEKYQEKLVSGTNIKTINNNALLGSGDITIEGGGGTALTDQEVEDAAEAAFPAYAISVTGGVAYSDSAHTQTATEARENDIIHIVCGYAVANSITSSPTVHFISEGGNVYSFFMPDSAISITITGQAGGGEND